MDPIAVDVPVVKPTPPAAKPEAKPEPPKPAEPPAAKGPPKPTFLSYWRGQALSTRPTKRQAAIAASAACSRAAGVAGVRLIWPAKPAPPPAVALTQAAAPAG